MLKRYFIASALVAATTFGGSGLAAAQQVASTAPSAVKAGHYKVEPYHTQVGFTLSHFGFSKFSGLFSGVSGSLTFDPSHVSVAHLDVTLPVASVETTVPKLDEELKGPQWFDASQFPTATFKSTRVVQTGKDTADITGDLTLHGVTQPITLKAHLVGSGVNPLDKMFTVGFEASATLARSKFGVSQYVPLVGDDVTLTIAGAFELQP
ncbi:YceI family protein [Acetobacter senegalensis]|uniref:YceI family protein n=1 Tax=Acetobacter senegalensis TaxID=446692 RepID=UPI00264FF97C|nr:YceI family protein [Acetobacter senegalensis]MDN7356247.1 YceI family protein [Acetobacter senegalensis]